MDLVKREGFGVFVDAFEELGERARGADAVLPNLAFVEGDISEVFIEPGGFVTCIQ